MLVIHPQDPSTDFLCALYEGLPVERLSSRARGAEARAVEALRRTPKGERLMMLGHGMPGGLFSLEKEPLGCVCAVGDAAAPELKGRPELVGIWCFANCYAEAHGLKGLWSGMIISEVIEGTINDIKVTQEEVTRENELLARHLRRFLDTVPLAEIPARMKALVHSPLTEFNYNNFHFYG